MRRTQTLFIRLSLGLSLGLILSFGVVADGVDRVIVLKDGSRIRGEIISVENDLYRIESDSMGTILLGSNQIQSILSGEQPGSLSRTAEGSQSAEGSLSRTAEGSQSRMQLIQSNMMSNPGVMSSIMALQNDPEMQAVLADPEVMKAIQSFDLEALARNPKVKALMNNPELKRIQGEIQ